VNPCFPATVIMNPYSTIVIMNPYSTIVIMNPYSTIVIVNPYSTIVIMNPYSISHNKPLPNHSNRTKVMIETVLPSNCNYDGAPALGCL
jgi:hypothetical protein